MNIFLDFDGVICNSLQESYHSSWLAWSGKTISGEPLQEPDHKQYWESFCFCRPFIREGREYLAIHECLKQGIQPKSQKEFDAALKQIGSQQLSHFQTILYQTREKLLQFHLDLWLSWNPLYLGIQESLQNLVNHRDVFILSTKKADYIAAILKYYHVAWPENRILYAGSQEKLALIEETVGATASIFIDDQIKHLDFHHPLYDCRLALWGFVKPEWIHQGVSTISLPEMLNLLKNKAT